MSAGRTTCECVSAVSCFDLGVTASMTVLPRLLLSYLPHHNRSRLRREITTLQAGLTNRRLERKPGIPGEIDPGVLRHFGDERVDHRPAHRLGIDRGEMGARQYPTHNFRGLAGIDQVVDDENARAPATAARDHAGGDVFENLQISLAGVIVARHAYRLDHADAKLARHDRSRYEAATGDADHRLERARPAQPPR